MKIYSYKGRKNLSGNKIREARLKQRLSQSDLAAKVQIEGVTLERDSISRIEIGTRFITDYELKVFAKVLKVNVSSGYWTKPKDNAEAIMSSGVIILEGASRHETF